MTFKHFIVTRFNLPIFQPKFGGEAVSRLDEGYLSYRFGLFERFCLPSIKGQTCQDFHWLVLFDSQTPDSFKERAMELGREYSRFVPVFLDMAEPFELPEEYSALSEDYDRRVGEAFPGRRFDLDIQGERILRGRVPLLLKRTMDRLSDCVPDWYLTTRIDNDDALDEAFVAEVQKRFKADPGHRIIDFVNTFKYIQDEGIVYSYPLENGHFLTLAEPSDRPFQSVLFWNHLYAELFLPVEHIRCRPLQMEVVHGGNVVNGFTEISLAGMVEGLTAFRPRRFHSVGLHCSAPRFIKVFGYLVRDRFRKRRRCRRSGN